MARHSANTRFLKSPPIVIIGEGLTEQFYFKHLRSIYNYHYTIKPYFFGTTSLNDMDLKIAKVIENGGVAVCVFDADVSVRNDVEKQKLERLRKKYEKKKNVILCDSLPSIEYWFLLHHENTNKHFNDSKAAEKELTKHIPLYEKTTHFLEKEKWVSDLCTDGKLQEAIKRAGKFGEIGASYSNIHKVFDKFKPSL